MKKDIHTKGIIEEDIELSDEDLTEEDFQDVAPTGEEESFYTEIGEDDENEDEDFNSADEELASEDVELKDGTASTKKDHRFKKGSKGRKPGAMDVHKRLSISTKDKLMDIISSNMDDFAEILSDCKKENPTKFLDIMKDMTKYIAPTLAAVTAEVNAEANITIEEQLKRLSQPRTKEE